MRLHEFEARLKQLCPRTYELAAPPKETRYIVWSHYGYETVRGDNGIVAHYPRVQLDIITQSASDPLPEAVMDLLEAMELPWEPIDRGYDDDFAAMRCILQLVVT